MGRRDYCNCFKAEPIMDTQCILCCQQPIIIGLLPCNHKLICHLCFIKMSQYSFLSCPICKQPSGTIVFTDDIKGDYETVAKAELMTQTTSTGIKYMYPNNFVKEIVERENRKVCYFQNCYLWFTSINGLKKHMNQQHKRQFCDLCLGNLKCLLSEQKVYTDPQISIHMSEGEVESSGSVSLYHPFCDFCRVRFYDQQTFVKHMGEAHEQCHVCNKYQCNKLIFYKDYPHMETHYQKSHYMCNHSHCETTRMLRVFESKEMLDFHYAQKHNNQYFSGKTKKKIQIQCNKLAGFNETYQNQKPKDHIGLSIQSQLISISRKVNLKVEQHIDGPIDIREFYPQKSLPTKCMPLATIADRLMYLCKQGYDLTLEGIDFFKPLTMKSLSRKEISQFIQKLYSYKSAQSLKQVFFQGMSDYKGYSQFCQVLEDMLCKNDQEIDFFYVFPQLIRYFKDENARKHFMDAYYLRRLKQLPSKINNIVIASNTYSKFVGTFLDILQKTIHKRVKSKEIDLALYHAQVQQENPKYFSEKSFYVDKQKVFNLFRMVDRVPTNKILLISWLLKVGMTLDTHQYIIKTVFSQTTSNVEGRLDALSNSDLALLYTYFKIAEYCFESKNRFQFQKAKSDTNILSDWYKRYTDIKAPVSSLLQPRLEKPSQEAVQTPKPVRPIFNVQRQPELPRRETPLVEAKKMVPDLLGFNKPLLLVKHWDEEQSIRTGRETSTRMTEEQELALAMSESKKAYAREMEKSRQIKERQEEAASKISKVNTLLGHPKLEQPVHYKEQPIQHKEQPDPGYLQAPGQQECDQTLGHNAQTKKKKKKYKQLNMHPTNNVFDQEKYLEKSRNNQTGKTIVVETKRYIPEKLYPQIARTPENAQQETKPWYQKILPKKPSPAVEVQQKKRSTKNGRTTWQPVNLHG